MQQLAPSPSQRGGPQYGFVDLEEMFEFSAAGWTTLSVLLGTIEAHFTDPNAPAWHDPIEIRLWGDTHKKCVDLSLPVSAEIALNLARDLVRGAADEKEKLSRVAYRERVVQFRVAMTAELKTIVFLRVSSDYKKYLSFVGAPHLFGEQVSSQFPSMADDIENAGRALAFGLGTASVFHSMRVMEAGLRALSTSLGIPYAPSWESHLKQIEQRITARHKTKGVKWKKDEPYFRELLGDLQAVKIAWRNPTMHVAKHYTQAEAENILSAVKIFMVNLSKRHGEFKRKT